MTALDPFGHMVTQVYGDWLDKGWYVTGYSEFSPPKFDTVMVTQLFVAIIFLCAGIFVRPLP